MNIIKTYQNPKPNLGMLLRNIILGGQDGLVNVLGIVLGIATATSSSHLVILTGLVATFAESVSMAAVAYTSSKAEIEHYLAERKKEEEEMLNNPTEARYEVETIFRENGFNGKLLDEVVEKICSDKKVWLKTMMREELKLSDPDDVLTPFKQGIVVGGSAMIGSLVPLAPYFFMPVKESMPTSVFLSLIILFCAGAYKSRITSGKWVRGGFEMMIVGGAAALAGYLVGVVFQITAI